MTRREQLCYDCARRFLRTMNNDSQETLLEKNAILDAISAMRQELKSDIGVLRQEMNARLTRLETEVEEIKSAQFGFDVRLERIEGAAYESLSIGHNLRADVKILRAEVGAWAKDVMRLETQMA